MKRITTLVLLFIATLTLSCITTTMHTVDYDFRLKEVERPVDARERYGEQKIVRFQDEGVTKYSFEDEMIKIVWLPTSYGFDFVLSNRTDHSIKIIWDEAVFVDEKGRSKRVMHSGVKYTERNNPQPPTTSCFFILLPSLVCDSARLPCDISSS